MVWPHAKICLCVVLSHDGGENRNLVIEVKMENPRFVCLFIYLFVVIATALALATDSEFKYFKSTCFSVKSG